MQKKKKNAAPCAAAATHSMLSMMVHISFWFYWLVAPHSAPMTAVFSRYTKVHRSEVFSRCFVRSTWTCTRYDMKLFSSTNKQTGGAILCIAVHAAVLQHARTAAAS